MNTTRQHDPERNEHHLGDHVPYDILMGFRNLDWPSWAKSLAKGRNHGRLHPFRLVNGTNRRSPRRDRLVGR